MKKSLGARTIAVPTPVWIVGTYDKAGRPNVMASAWAGICCSKPPCIYVSLRKATYTYGNLMERKAFTVSIPSEDYAKKADYIGLVSGRDVDKFAVTELTPVRSELVDAPYVGEFPLILECRVIQTVEIGLHTQFIGEIVDVKADESVLDDNIVGIRKIKPIIFNPSSRTYHGVGKHLGKAFSVGKEKTEKRKVM